MRGFYVPPTTVDWSGSRMPCTGQMTSEFLAFAPAGAAMLGLARVCARARATAARRGSGETLIRSAAPSPQVAAFAGSLSLSIGASAAPRSRSAVNMQVAAEAPSERERDPAKAAT